MVSFNELETFLAFFVFSSTGNPLIIKEFHLSDEIKSFPPDQVYSLLSSAYDLSQTFHEDSITEGQIFHLDFASLRIAGILRSEGLFSLITSASASLLDIEFKLRTLMTLFLGNFSDRLSKKNIRLSNVEKEEFSESIMTVMTGESRYMTESMKHTIDQILKKWIENDEAVRGACISSFTGAIIVNRMDNEVLPAAIRAIRGAFAAHLEKPKFFLAASGVSNIFVYILGEGLLLLVDANPDISSAITVERVENKVPEIRSFLL